MLTFTTLNLIAISALAASLYNKKQRLKTIPIVLAFFLIEYLTVPYWTGTWVTTIINDAEIKPSGNGTSAYMVFTDHETFVNTDCRAWLKFHSSDFHGKILKYKSQKVNIFVCGIRSPYLSWWRNIISIEPHIDPMPIPDELIQQRSSQNE